MRKKGFAMQQCLIILSFLIFMHLSLLEVVAYSIKTCRNLVQLETQKSIELIIYSYFINHYETKEYIDVIWDNTKITYSNHVNDYNSTLKVHICIDSCYQIESSIDHETKEIQGWEYKKI